MRIVRALYDFRNDKTCSVTTSVALAFVGYHGLCASVRV